MSVIRNVLPASRRAPLIGVVCDRQILEGAPYLACEERYVVAVRVSAGVVPFLIPAMEEKILHPDEILPHLDGLIFTGSPSNIDPSLYGASTMTPKDHDVARDAVSFPLLEAALERNVPLLATCRGMQELNVACGGTLHQKVHELPGYMDHREDETLSYEAMYEPTHVVDLTPDGFLASLCDNDSELAVNSLHGQGINRLGEGLVVEAVAPDGLIEAVRYADHPFAIGTQFHPEWAYDTHSFSINLFKAFGKALRGELDLRREWPSAGYRTAKNKITA